MWYAKKQDRHYKDLINTTAKDTFKLFFQTY